MSHFKDSFSGSSSLAYIQFKVPWYIFVSLPVEILPIISKMRQQKTQIGKGVQLIKVLLLILAITYATLFNKTLPTLPGVLNSQCINSTVPVQQSSFICKLNHISRKPALSNMQIGTLKCSLTYRILIKASSGEKSHFHRHQSSVKPLAFADAN